MLINPYGKDQCDTYPGNPKPLSIKSDNVDLVLRLRADGKFLPAIKS